MLLEVLDEPLLHTVRTALAAVLTKAELAAADDPDGHLASIKERLNKLRSPFRSAEYFEIEEIIDPRHTRENLCRWANLAYRALKPGSSQFTYRP